LVGVAFGAGFSLGLASAFAGSTALSTGAALLAPAFPGTGGATATFAGGATGTGFASPSAGGFTGVGGAGAASWVGAAGAGAFARGAGVTGRTGPAGGGGGGTKNNGWVRYHPPIRITPIPAMIRIRRNPPARPPLSSGSLTSVPSSSGSPSSSVLRLRKVDLAMSPPLFSGAYHREA